MCSFAVAVEDEGFGEVPAPEAVAVLLGERSHGVEVLELRRVGDQAGGGGGDDGDDVVVGLTIGEAFAPGVGRGEGGGDGGVLPGRATNSGSVPRPMKSATC
ncbi:hypothetical protein [Nocardia sp. CNY236]|uniref:hypothetical protein n=1 Tax=Nocardia sp. CNY236 TaxID=1169152 RepID=UPI00040AA1E4|nr:hypothetical protein [Nocardia sp. CNY236]